MQRTANLPRNLLSVFSGQLLTWASSAIYFIVIPRYLGPDGTGVISVGATYAGLVLLFGGLGMATLITREVARSVQDAGKWIALGIVVQAVLALLGAGIAIGVAVFTGASTPTIVAVTVSSLTAPAMLLSLTVIAVLRGLERMPLAATYNVLTRAGSLVFVGAVVLFDGGLYAVIFATNAATILLAVVQAIHLRHLVPIQWDGVSLSRAIEIARASAPFFMVTVFFVLYTSTDIFMLSVLADERDAGMYSAPARIFGTLIFVPTTISTVVFPRLSAASRGDARGFHRLSGASLLYAATATGAIVIIAVGMSDEAIVALLGSEFEQTGPVILAFSASLLPTALNTVSGHIAFASDRQRLMSAIGACAFVANLVLAILLIPFFDARWGNAALGAALGLVAVEWVMAPCMLYFLPRHIWNRDLVRRAIAFAASLLICVVALLAMMPFVGGWAASGIAVFAYAACLLLTGVHHPAELLGFARRALERRQKPVLSP